MRSVTHLCPNFCNSNMDIAYEGVENAADIEQLYMNPSFPGVKYVTPYLDHCYAAELPTVPTDSQVDSPTLPLAEPLAAYVDIVDVRMDNLRNQYGLGLNNQRPPMMTMPVINSLCRQGAANNNNISSSNINTNVNNNNNGNANSSNNNNNNNNNINGGGDGEVDPYEGSVTRCICDFQHDDGYMICCDRCGVWQHVDCMGVDRKRIPDSYLCELCYPRQVDKRRAVRIQSKKKEEFEMEESSGSAEDSVEEEKKPKKRRRKKEQSKRKNSTSEVTSGQVKKQRKRTSSEMEKPNHKADQKRPKKQHMSNNSGSDNAAGGDMWRLTSSSLKDPADVVYHSNVQTTSALECRNTYSPEVLGILMVKVKSMGANNSSSTLAIVREQLSKRCFRVVLYEDNSKGLESIDNIKVNQAVAEYTGNTVLRQDYEKNCQSDLSYPFAVCYMGITGVELCVDSSHSDNEAKYVRRSCTPNAKVVHILDKNGLRFFICATKTIPLGKEITIPFYFDYHRSMVEVKCPCGKSNCLVAKYFKDFNTGSVTSTVTTTTTTTTSASTRTARQTKKKQTDDNADVMSSTSATVADPPQQHEELKTSSGRVVKPPRNRQTSEHLFPSSTASNTSNSAGLHTENSNNISLLHGKSDSAKNTKAESSGDAQPQKMASTLETSPQKTEVSGKSDATGVEVDAGDNETEKQAAEKPMKKPSHLGRKQNSPPSKQDNKKDDKSDTKEKEKKKSNDGSTTDEKPQDSNDNDTDDNSNGKSKSKKKNSKLLAEIQTSLKLGEKESEDKKSREQRKIEAAEKRFEKIEQAKSNVSSGKSAASKPTSTSSKTRPVLKENTTSKSTDNKKTTAKSSKATVASTGKVKLPAATKGVTKSSAAKQEVTKQADKAKKLRTAGTTTSTTTSTATTASSRSTRSSKR